MGMGTGTGRTMSWVTCFGLKPSAAVADRVSDEDAGGPGEDDSQRQRRRRRGGGCE